MLDDLVAGRAGRPTDVIPQDIDLPVIGQQLANLPFLELGKPTPRFGVRVDPTDIVFPVVAGKILPIRGEWRDGYLYAITEDDPR